MNDDVHFTDMRSTEFIGGGDLRALLYDSTQSLKLSEMVQFMVEISNGMTHLHRHDIVHRFVVDISRSFFF
jgi:serine/threonine protein kinase